MVREINAVEATDVAGGFDYVDVCSIVGAAIGSVLGSEGGVIGTAAGAAAGGIAGGYACQDTSYLVDVGQNLLNAE